MAVSHLVLAVLGCCVSAHAASEVTVGDIRVQALSETLLRIEPKGPMGFESRTTFMVVDRSFSGIDITVKSQTNTSATLTTSAYNIMLKFQTSSDEPTCAAPLMGMDSSNPVRTTKYAGGYKASSRTDCCNACDGDSECTGFVFVGNNIEATESTATNTRGYKDVPGANCWPLSAVNGVHAASDREVACAKGKSCLGGLPYTAIVTSPSGTVLYNSTANAANKKTDCGSKSQGDCTTPCFWDKDAKKCTNQFSGTQDNLLHWPSPMSTPAYGLVDHPRFYTPPWAVAPAPSSVDPALKETNGYDFRNNVDGDLYVFLLGSTLDEYHASRREFIKLAGPCPVLPDFAFGTWFTYWHSYTETEAKSDVSHWQSGNLPIDVWALDMNWRNTSNHQDWYYDHPNTALFPNFTEWFEYLKENKLRTYFNDHPYPVAARNAGGLQTSPEEVAFRWNGISEWMSRGLTYWWFDHNWGFSIPPPFINISHTSGDWEGLDNAAWGSHVYFSSVEYYDRTVRDKQGDKWYGGRPMTLTKFGLPDWRPGMPAVGHQESPAQHRFPVWWTGDGVPLQGSVESMVDCGVHDFKPYVHSDCGGDYRPKTGGDLLRWTAHCAYGSIHRFHGADHRPWGYDNHTEDVIRDYLNSRYKLAPSLIAAGHTSAETGFPFVTRGDLIWPEHAEDGARDNTQYIFLNDTLVAPIFDSTNNMTSRSVWIPPGTWQDAWTGQSVTGPKDMTVSKPYEQQPMFHNQNGGLVVTTNKQGLRIEEGDWSTLTLEAFPSVGTSCDTHRSVVERGTSDKTHIHMLCDGAGSVDVRISEPEDAMTERAWTLRVHLRPGQSVGRVQVDSVTIDANTLTVLKPIADKDATVFPFSGDGTPPAPHAGPIVEVPVSASKHPRSVNVQIL